MIIAMVDDNYTTYDCTEHGIFQKRKMQFHYKGELYEIKVEKVAQKESCL